MNRDQSPVIRLCYRKIINHTSISDWDKMVWDSTYTELQLQQQFYDSEGKYNHFADLLHQVPAAEKLHFLVSAAVGGYLQQLQGIIPDIQDNLGKRVLPFTQYRFEIINSSRTHKSEHAVAVSFYSEPLLLLQTIGEYLVLTGEHILTDEQGFAPAFTIRVQPFLSIAYFKNVSYDTTNTGTALPG